MFRSAANRFPPRARKISLEPEASHGGNLMKREIIRVEPLSTWLERWKAPTSAATRAGDTVYETPMRCRRNRRSAAAK
jgi:hypothetical protein